MTAFAAFDVPAIIGWGNRIFTFTTYLYLLLNPQDALPQLRPRRRALDRRARDRRADELVVRPRCSSARAASRSSPARPTGRRSSSSAAASTPPGASSAPISVLSKLMPILLLIWSSLLPFFQLPSARAFAFVSLAHYRTLPWELVLRRRCGNTSVLAVLAPTVTLAISLAFSWIVLRSRVPRPRALFDFIAFLPHAVPSIVFGVGALLLTLYSCCSARCRSTARSGSCWSCS